MSYSELIILFKSVLIIKNIIPAFIERKKYIIAALPNKVANN